MPPTPCNLALNPFQSQIAYTVNGETSPTFQVYPQITGLVPFNPSPFNSKNTPFLLPAAAESFGFNTQAISAPNNDPVYWQVTLRYYDENNAIMADPGDSSQNVGPFNFVSGNADLLNPGQSSVLTGFTAFSAQNVYLFKPADLPLNTPVRLEITLSAFSDASFSNKVSEVDPSDNVLSFWVIRCGAAGKFASAPGKTARADFNPQPDPPG